MKKRLALILGGWVVWVFLMTIPVFADAGIHRKYTGSGTLPTSCAGCHRAHTADAPELLKQAQPGLCYSCHGETGQGGELNVEGGVEFADVNVNSPIADYTPGQTGGSFEALKGGGFLYAVLDANNPVPGPLTIGADQANNTAAISQGHIGLNGGTTPLRQPTTSAHSVDPTANVTMWGNGGYNTGAGASVQLTCGNCHDPHGNGNYRILRGVPNGATTGGSVSAVNIADEATKDYSTDNYWDVSYPSAPEVVQKISSWCSTCHTRYLASYSASSTNTGGDSIFSFRHMTNTDAAFSPICLQCHVAHGTNAVMSGSSGRVALPGQPEPPSTATANASDSRLLRAKSRGVCQMCHLR
jgi:predicted CXXCH cytochrome family protein